MTFRLGHTSVRAEFDRWGKPVHVVRPARGQIVSGIAAPVDGTA